MSGSLLSFISVMVLRCWWRTVLLKDKGEGDSHFTTVFPWHVPGSVPQLFLPFCSVWWGRLAKWLCSAYRNCVSWQGTRELGGISCISFSDGCLEALLAYSSKIADTTAWRFSRERLMRVLCTSEGVFDIVQVGCCFLLEWSVIFIWRMMQVGEELK